MRSHVLKGGVADNMKTVADMGQFFVRCNRRGSKNWRHLTCALEMLADVHRGVGSVKRRMEAEEKEPKKEMKALTAEVGAPHLIFEMLTCGC